MSSADVLRLVLRFNSFRSSAERNSVTWSASSDLYASPPLSLRALGDIMSKESDASCMTIPEELKVVRFTVSENVSMMAPRFISIV